MVIIIAQCCSSLSSQTGQTALMSASSGGHLPIVERLLAAGAQPDMQKKVLLIQWGWEVMQSTKSLGMNYYIYEQIKSPAFVNGVYLLCNLYCILAAKNDFV